MSADPHKCMALVPEPPHYFHRHVCSKNAKYEILPGFHVCGTHKRVADKWEREERLERMVAHWWKP